MNPGQEGAPDAPDIPGAGARPRAAIHGPSLGVALAIMVAGSVYPILFADAKGQADHGLAMALFWAMSAGFVRGVGYIPVARVWRWLFSGWACALALLLAAWLRWGG